MTKAEAAPKVTIFVCTACGLTDETAPSPHSPGARLAENLRARLAAGDGPASPVTVTPVDCLAVCERPLTLAFSSPGKWSYVIGDIDPEKDVADILEAASAVARSPHGIPAMADRPPFFRKGVICRLPPPDAE